jgi:alkanesulfonate monooxygenase SsuD/methylene tetrahydromethanopterin reductase-like flavin-dependent oxidoreductase (luciferase family)
VKLGLLVQTEEGLDWAGWRRVYTNAERLGFHSVWISDHFQSAYAAERHGLDAWVALAVAAAETRRVVFGPLVSPITFRAPAIVARMAESLYDLSQGRFVLGLGLGWNAAEHAANRIIFPPAMERRRQLEEGIRQIRRDLDDRRVPLIIGGGGPRSTLPIVARYADYWNMTTNSVEVFRARSERLSELCRAAGRNPAEIQRSVAVGYLLGRNEAELAMRSERVRSLIPPLTEAVDTVDAARQMGWIIGTFEAVKHLTAPGEAGADMVILGHYDVTDDAALELIC